MEYMQSVGVGFGGWTGGRGKDRREIEDGFPDVG